MFNEKNLKNATLMQDCENPKKFYLCVEDWRYIFEEGNYVGWYHPELNKVV